jgi:hypothetical protein
MSNESSKLELAKVLQSEANEIISARDKAEVLYGTKDIRAAGNEVEKAVRDVLRRKLSAIYHVGHGHIADSTWTTSPQLDVIIADNLGAPELLCSGDGTQYFPYESVYAIGEIKTTYYKSKKYIHEFSDKIAWIRSTLQRESNKQSLSGWSDLASKMDLPESIYGSSNPLFAFMLFVDAGDFVIDDIRDLYATKEHRALPNILCFLNKGVIQFKLEGQWVNGHSWSFDSLHTGLSEEVNLMQQSGQSGHWYFNQFEGVEGQGGTTLGFLVALLSSFLKRCRLIEPDMYAYLESIFRLRESSKIS